MKKLLKRVFGWIPDLPDGRDFRYALVSRKQVQALPAAVDLRDRCSAIEDQGALGSCTANALVGALEMLEIKNGLPAADFSRLFLYYNERRLEGTILWDSGARLRDGIKTLARQGCCLEARWPYVPARYRIKPLLACYREGKKHQITEYQRLDTVEQMKTCLAGGFPFVFGFSVYDSFMTEAVAKTGKGQMPAAGDKVRGGHAVLAVGYDDAQRRFIIRNSWGREWGLAGFFTLPYAYLASRDLSDDFWTIRAGNLM